MHVGGNSTFEEKFCCYWFLREDTEEPVRLPSSSLSEHAFWVRISFGSLILSSVIRPAQLLQKTVASFLFAEIRGLVFVTQMAGIVLHHETALPVLWTLCRIHGKPCSGSFPQPLWCSDCRVWWDLVALQVMPLSWVFTLASQTVLKVTGVWVIAFFTLFFVFYWLFHWDCFCGEQLLQLPYQAHGNPTYGSSSNVRLGCVGHRGGFSL